MNKKFLCGILACVMAFGSMLPMAACKDKPEQEQGGTQGGGQGGNQGGNNQGGNQGGNNQGGGENKDPSDIQPGTVITDPNFKSELYNSLSETQIGGFTYSASANLSVTGEAMEQTQKIVSEGAIVVKDGKVQADVSAYVSGSDGEEPVNQYMLLFLRDETAYRAAGDWESEDGVDFSAIKAQLKDKTEPIVLLKDELDGGFEELVETPALIKMIKNVPSLFNGVVTKTEGGYSLEFDIVSAVDSVFDGLTSIVSAIEETANMTLGNLFGHSVFKTTLEKLLHGITAEELKDVAEKFLPEEVAESLPEPAENATAISYAESLLRSGSFYKALTQEGDAWTEWKTFAEVPLEGLISLFTGSEFSFGELKLQEMLKEYKKKWTSEAVALCMNLLGLDEGEISDENINLSFGFDFDNDKKLLGFSLDALLAGSRTLPPEEQEPEEGQTPEEGQPDDEQVPGEGELTAETAKAKAAEEAQGKKYDVKGSIKLSAASASAPELFDLTGCKYYTEDGEIATI